MGPKILKILKEMVSTKIVHTSGTFLEFCFEKMSTNNVKPCSHIQNNFTESEYDVQNNDALHKIHQKYQNIFDSLEMFGNLLTKKKRVCYIYKFRHSYFGMFANFVKFVILGFLFVFFLYNYIYYTCRPLTRVGPLHV